MSDLVVRPVRFTDNVDGMRRFLEALGLRPRLESESGGWVDMVAGGGMVALHSASAATQPVPSGLTSLSFEADHLSALAVRLQAAQVPGVTIYDEAYGRALRCRDPLDDDIVLDERADDLYGYREHASGDASEDLRVVAVRFADPVGDYARFLEALGLRRRGGPNEHYSSFAAGNGDHGLVALHQVREGKPPFASAAGSVELSFETSESLDDVAERLTDKGFPAVVSVEAFGPVLSTVDADGLSVEVHRAPPG